MTLGLQRIWTEPARPAWVRSWPGAPWLAVATVCVGAFMGQLDASIVTVALPNLRDNLHASLSVVEWVSLSYLVVLVGAVSAVGRLADVAGRKLLYIHGFAVFTMASLGCALAPSLAVLLLMRVVQAGGAAMLQANSVALMRTTVGPQQLGRAIGAQGAAQAMGLALGPVVGGLLIQAGGWRWVFYVNVPAGILGIALGWWLLPRSRHRAPRARFDWAGLLTLPPGTVLLLLALSLLAHPGPTAPVGVLMAASMCLSIAFVRVERRAKAPLVDLRVFGDGRVAAAIASGLLGYLVLFGLLLVSPLYLESAFHASPGAAGLIITVLPLGLGLAAPLAGIAADHGGRARVTVLGMLVVCAALGAASVLPSGRSTLIGVLAAAGVGLGLFTPSNNATVAAAGRLDQAGMVSGALNMTRGIGTSLGIAVVGIVFTATGAAGAGVTAAQGAHGFRVTVIVLAIVAAVAALASVRSAR